MPTGDNQELPVVFKKITFKQNYEAGSKESLEFHGALENTESDSVYGTEAIQAILKYKWSQVKYIARIQGLIMI